MIINFYGPIINYAVGECHYLYDTVPASSNDSTCAVSEGNTVYFSCTVYDRCNSISVLWYKSRNVRTSSEQAVTGSQGPGGKFQIFAIDIPADTSNLAGYCSTASFLVINNFNNINDSGYYWCQILANGSLLLPSPHGYLSLKLEGDHPCGNGDLNHYLSPRLCAEHPASTKPITIPTTIITPTSESVQNEYNQPESDSLLTTLNGAVTAVTVNLRTNEKDLLYGTTIGVLLSVITAVLMILLCTCLAMRWHKSQQRRSKLSFYVIMFNLVLY